MPPGAFVAKHDIARRLGYYRTVSLGAAMRRLADRSCVIISGEYIARKIGVYDVAKLPVPYRGQKVPFKDSIQSKGARILWSALKPTSIVVLGKAFDGALLVERDDGATISDVRVTPKTVEILHQHGLLDRVVTDDFADYMGVSTICGTTVMWSVGTASF